MIASIIVPVFNRKDLIAQCIHSLLQQNASDYEIIIVDDGSTDGTSEILKQLNSTKRLYIFYLKKNSGLAHARNHGIKKSHGKLLAFIDSDCVAHPSWLDEIIRPFSDDQSIMITAGKVIDGPLSNYWEGVNKNENFIQKTSGFVKRAIGCNMAARREFMCKYFFDEKIPASAGEDMDFSLSCLKEGYKIFYNHEAHVTHYRRSSFRATLHQKFNYGLCNTYVYLKHKQFPYINYGTYLLLSILLFLITGMLLDHAFLIKISFGMLLTYLCFIFYVSLTLTQKTFCEAIIYYPGFILGCLANSAGNIFYLITFLFKTKKS